MAAIIEAGPDPWRRHQDPACDDITVFWIPCMRSACRGWTIPPAVRCPRADGWRTPVPRAVAGDARELAAPAVQPLALPAHQGADPDRSDCAPGGPCPAAARGARHPRLPVPLPGW